MRRGVNRTGALGWLALSLALTAPACRRVEDVPPPDAPSSPARAATSRAPATAPRADAAVVFHPAGAPPARVAVEVALSAREIQRGLMYREHLPPDGGMIFVFRREKMQSFWMKNTLIALDLIFVARDRKVVGVVERAEPRTLTSRSVPTPSQFVVEVNAGWAAAHGVRAGVPVTLEGVPVERATVD